MMTKRDGVVAAISAVVTATVLLLVGTLQSPDDGSMGADVQPSGFPTDAGQPRTPTPTSDGGDEPEDVASGSKGEDPVDMSTDEPAPDTDGEPEDAPVLAGAPPAGEGPVPSGAQVRCPDATVEVRSGEELADALESAEPGDVIGLADGTYEGEFVADTAGTEDDPIFLCGSRKAVLDGTDVEGGYVLHLDGASHWRLVGFSVRNGQKGVMTDAVTGVVIQGLLVDEIGDEAIHLRNGSSRNVIQDNEIGRTGLRRDKFGEGVYIGTAVSNWCSYSNCRADRSDYNLVEDNTFRATSSEAIDLKEGTTGGVITGNSFDGSSITGADSWVDVKGNNYLISDNAGRDAPEDGFQTHQILPKWGDNNVFSGNRAIVNGPGNGISSWPPGSNVVTCSNTSTAAAEGLSNIDCS